MKMKTRQFYTASTSISRSKCSSTGTASLEPSPCKLGCLQQGLLVEKKQYYSSLVVFFLRFAIRMAAVEFVFLFVALDFSCYSR